MSQSLDQPQKRGYSMSFRSILFEESEADIDVSGLAQPQCFADLNLDQIVASMTDGRDEYKLTPIFYNPLRRIETINYRHGVLRDLENPALFGHVEQFAQEMRKMREHLRQAEKLHYKYQKQRWFLDAVCTYCGAVQRLIHDLTDTNLCSDGFTSFRQYLSDYSEFGDLTSLANETRELHSDLAGIRYCFYIEGNRIEVHQYALEADYGAGVLQTFAKFQQEAAREFRFDFPSTPSMNHVEAAILDRVAQLYPDIFLSLDEYCSRRRNYLDGTIDAFDREVQFYVACIENSQRYKAVGLPFCYPTVTNCSKEVYGRDVFDLALANKLIRGKAEVVTNDFYLRNPERIFVVSGPNQGGKTTFARTFGQAHYLASLGCPVPGEEARLFLFDSLFTHFESEENIQNLSGKLEDDLIRVRSILEHATPSSILIMNESFVSTTLDDALFLSKQIMQQIIQRDMLCVSVTFLDELASLGETTVSMVCTVHSENPVLRTFKVVRKPADGLAYAQTIAEKYKLTYQSVKRRIAS